MLHKGDRVIYKTDPRKLRGTVVNVDSTVTWYSLDVLVEVEWDDKALIPHTMRLRESDLELIAEYSSFSGNMHMSGCECGLKFTREGGRHSPWCKLFKEED